MRVTDRKIRMFVRSLRRRALFAGFVIVFVVVLFSNFSADSNQFENTQTTQFHSSTIDTISFKNGTTFERPEMPITVGLQVGHLENHALPDELESLRGVSTGATGGGTTEVAVVSNIASLTAGLLEEQGITVNIIPATVPEDYYADAFVAIHTDGNTSSSASGYKVVDSQLSLNDDSENLSEAIGSAYEASTQLRQDNNITGNMKYYYAFNWMRFDHSVHPMTPAAILETGFITSYEDQRILIDQPELAAKGLADGILDFLQKEHPI